MKSREKSVKHIEDMRKELATILKEYSPLIDGETQQNIDEKILTQLRFPEHGK